MDRRQFLRRAGGAGLGLVLAALPVDLGRGNQPPAPVAQSELEVTIASMLTPRAYSAVLWDNNGENAYIVGGLARVAETREIEILGQKRQSSTFRRAALKSVEKYDLSRNRMTEFSQMTTARVSPAIVPIGNEYLLILGGYTLKEDELQVLGSAELMNLKTGESLPIGADLITRYAHSATIGDDGLIYILGGRTGSKQTPYSDILEVLKFEPGTKPRLNRLQKREGYFTAAHLGTAFAGGVLYGAGGIRNEPLDEIVAISTREWVQNQLERLPGKLGLTALAYVDGSLYIASHPRGSAVGSSPVVVQYGLADQQGHVIVTTEQLEKALQQQKQARTSVTGVASAFAVQEKVAYVSFAGGMTSLGPRVGLGAEDVYSPQFTVYKLPNKVGR